MEITGLTALPFPSGLSGDAGLGGASIGSDADEIVPPELGGGGAALAGGSVAPAFGQVLSGFLGQVDGAQHQADAMVESLALGEPVDVHQVMLALNEASDALHLTLTVRSKILDAYQELMRTPM